MCSVMHTCTHTVCGQHAVWCSATPCSDDDDLEPYDMPKETQTAGLRYLRQCIQGVQSCGPPPPLPKGGRGGRHSCGGCSACASSSCPRRPGADRGCGEVPVCSEACRGAGQDEPTGAAGGEGGWLGGDSSS